MEKRDKTVIVAVIGLLGLIIAAFITTFGPDVYRSLSAPAERPVIAGMVIDQSSNLGIGQAVISLVGRTETYVTEDSGNFTIQLHGIAREGQQIRVHVTKDGYRPFDEAVTPSTENLVIPLTKP